MYIDDDRCIWSINDNRYIYIYTYIDRCIGIYILSNIDDEYWWLWISNIDNNLLDDDRW